MRGPILTAALLAAVASAARAGDIVGTVRFAGTPPALAPAETTKDRAVCGDAVEDESLVISGGHVADAVLVVQGAPAPAPVRATLDQQRCRFRPHVQAVPVGSTLDVRNGDPILHSVRGREGKRTRFDLVMPSQGEAAPTPLPDAGGIRIDCDVHSWMRAWVVEADAPAAVTGRDGAFAIRGLPAGTYTVRAWHERLGERTVPVTVPAKGEVRVDVVYGG